MGETIFYPTQRQFLCMNARNSEQTKKKCVDLIVKIDAPFTLLDHPQFKKFCNYLVVGAAGIPSRNFGR